MGQLIVTIPDWAGIPNLGDPMGDTDGVTAEGITVSYASPFFGQSYGTDDALDPDTPFQSGQSYGMWFVPPDIGCTVLVTFVAGDLNRGYWFACVYNTPSHHMVPGLGRSIAGAKEGTRNPGDSLSSKLTSDSVLPVVEADISESTIFGADGFVKTPRYPHEMQAYTLIQQGLDRDPVRGAISSSSMRESPSNVYGISTPGRKAGKTDQYAGRPQQVAFRTGGHQFVMDDGADGDSANPEGTDQLIRLRTAGGHQILMNDTTGDGIVDDGASAPGIIYIASKSGSQWLEFSATGAINMYGAGGFNLRTTGGMNFHSDSSITMNAPHISLNSLPSLTPPTSAMGALGMIPSITLNSAGMVNVSSVLATKIVADGALTMTSMGAVMVASGGLTSISAGAALGLSAGGIASLKATGVTSISGATIQLNNPAAAAIPGVIPPIPALPPIPMSLPDTVFTDTWSTSTLLSTCSVVPAHEPWKRYKPQGSLLGLGLSLGVGAVNGSGSSTTKGA
jgi:hypothetical protein